MDLDGELTGELLFRPLRDDSASLWRRLATPVTEWAAEHDGADLLRVSKTWHPAPLVTDIDSFATDTFDFHTGVRWVASTERHDGPPGTGAFGRRRRRFNGFDRVTRLTGPRGTIVECYPDGHDLVVLDPDGDAVWRILQHEWGLVTHADAGRVLTHRRVRDGLIGPHRRLLEAEQPTPWAIVMVAWHFLSGSLTAPSGGPG